MATEYLDFDEEEQIKGYEMVLGEMEYTSTYMPRVWNASTGLQSHVYITYYYKRQLPLSETPSRELDAILYAMSSAMGIWQSEDDEDL